MTKAVKDELRHLCSRCLCVVVIFFALVWIFFSDQFPIALGMFFLSLAIFLKD